MLLNLTFDDVTFNFRYRVIFGTIGFVRFSVQVYVLVNSRLIQSLVS